MGGSIMNLIKEFCAIPNMNEKLEVRFKKFLLWNFEVYKNGKIIQWMLIHYYLN